MLLSFRLAAATWVTLPAAVCGLNNGLATTPPMVRLFISAFVDRSVVEPQNVLHQYCSLSNTHSCLW